MKEIIAISLILTVIYCLQLSQIDRFKFPQFNKDIKTIQFSHDQSFYAVCSNTGEVKVYNNTNNKLQNYKEVFKTTATDQKQFCLHIKFTHDDKIMVVSSTFTIYFYYRIQTPGFFNATPGTLILNQTYSYSYMAISHDDKILAMTNSDTVLFYDIQTLTFTFMQTIEGSLIYEDIKFSPTQNLLLIPFTNEKLEDCVGIYQVQNQKLSLKYLYNFSKNKKQFIVEAQFSPDGKIVYLLTDHSLYKHRVEEFIQLSKYSDRSVNFTQFRLIGGNNTHFIIKSREDNAKIYLQVLDAEMKLIQTISFLLNNNLKNLVLGNNPRKGMILLFKQESSQIATNQYVLTRYSLCSQGFYYEYTNDTCIACNDSNCKVCSTDPSICENCKPYYYVNNSNQCVQSPIGCQVYDSTTSSCYWCGSEQMENIGSFCACKFPKLFDIDSNTCQYCNQIYPGCLSCSSVNYTQVNCLQCDSSQNWILQHNKCVCSRQFYQHPKGKVCIKCIPYCERCNDERSCISCKEGFSFTSSNQCLQSYPLQYIMLLSAVGVLLLILFGVVLYCLIKCFIKARKTKYQHLQTLFSQQNRISLQKRQSIR